MTVVVVNTGGGDGVEQLAVGALLGIDHKADVVGHALVEGRVTHGRALCEDALGLAHVGFNALPGRMRITQAETGEGHATLLVQVVEVAYGAEAVVRLLCRSSVQALVVTAAVLRIRNISSHVSRVAVGDA